VRGVVPWGVPWGRTALSEAVVQATGFTGGELHHRYAGPYAVRNEGETQLKKPAISKGSKRKEETDRGDGRTRPSDMGRATATMGGNGGRSAGRREHPPS
jgi:hypothetical protein